MAKTKKAQRKKVSRRKAAPRRTSRFVCPQCGFKAAHAMGLGRHRTTQHGVPSQRQLAGRRASKGSEHQKITRLERRVAQLEKRYDTLVKGLRKAGR